MYSLISLNQEEFDVQITKTSEKIDFRLMTALKMSYPEQKKTRFNTLDKLLIVHLNLHVRARACLLTYTCYLLWRKIDRSLAFSI